MSIDVRESNGKLLPCPETFNHVGRKSHSHALHHLLPGTHVSYTPLALSSQNPTPNFLPFSCASLSTLRTLSSLASSNPTTLSPSLAIKQPCNHTATHASTLPVTLAHLTSLTPAKSANTPYPLLLNIASAASTSSSAAPSNASFNSFVLHRGSISSRTWMYHFRISPATRGLRMGRVEP